jgi:hypothetical protein
MVKVAVTRVDAIVGTRNAQQRQLARVGGTCTVEPNEDDEGGVTVRAWVPL